jgi:mRNA interferase MazF
VKRGDLVLVALPGDYGKPRPAVIIQSDQVTGTDSILVCLFTSDLQASVIFRVAVEPDSGNDLRELSQIMVDKIYAVRRDKCGRRIGRLSADKLIELDEGLALVVGLADAPSS